MLREEFHPLRDHTSSGVRSPRDVDREQERIEMMHTRSTLETQPEGDRMEQHPVGQRGRPRTTDPRVNLGAAVPIDLRDALDLVTPNRSAYVERLLLSDPDVFEAWSEIKLRKGEVAATQRRSTVSPMEVPANATLIPENGFAEALQHLAEDDSEDEETPQDR